MKKTLLTEVICKAEQWMLGNYNEETKRAIRLMLDAEDKTELIDSFYKNLEFGTGGLRGIMGAGTNRINIYTIGAATQGLANYLKAQFDSQTQISVVIGFDCRNQSDYFAQTAANILTSSGIKIYLFDSLRPTPEISFAIRHLKCQAGINITASHNPKEYNGYKVYWEDGAQIVSPHDVGVIKEVEKITDINTISFEGNNELLQRVGKDIDDLYIQTIAKLKLAPESIEKYKDLKIVYTPIHGTGVELIPMAIRAYGFTNIINVPEQDIVSGNFPTVASPNPEEPEALDMAIKKACEVNADIVMASDPDGDRVGIAVKDSNDKWILINGNQMAVILCYYLINKWRELGWISGKEYIVKTIVTTEIIKELAVKNNIECVDCYTGFKWIASVIREREGIKKYICGGEESYGFLPETFVRDKDAISTCALLAEITAWAKDKGKTIYELLQDIYLEYGYGKEKGISIVRTGKSGADEIARIMENFRNNPPVEIADSAVSIVKDFKTLLQTNMLTGEKIALQMPNTSNVLQFFTTDGSKISIRPSGTEPKIKFYIEVRGNITDRSGYVEANKEATIKIEKIYTDLSDR